MGIQINGNTNNINAGIGSLSIEDLNELDIVGVITARNGIDCNGDIDVDGHTNLDNVSIAGVTTFGNNIFASGTSRFEIASMENALLDGSIEHTGDTDTKLQFGTDTIDLHTGGSTRVAIANTGVSIPQDLDVDGQTNLDHVSVVGVTTTTGNITIDGLHSGASPRMLNIGSGNNILRIYENSSQSPQIYTQGDLVLTGATTEIRSKSGSNQLEASFHATNGVKLYHNNNEKLFVNDSGVNITGIVTATAFVSTAGQLSNRNKIQNGAMNVSQRFDGDAHTPSSTSRIYTLDRWAYWSNQASKTTIQQVEDAPVGFKYSSKCTVASAYSIASGDWFGYMTHIEGQDLYDLELGNSNAKAFTLSFYVKSSVAGTWAGSIRTKGSSPDHSYPYNYTINSANTWEKKTITVPGPTSGTWVGGRSEGMCVWFDLGSGSAYHSTANQWASANRTGPSSSPFIANAGATWQITGVQLEKGSAATEYEHRSAADETSICERYCEVMYGTNIEESNEATMGIGHFYQSSRMIANYQFHTQKRVGHNGETSDYGIRNTGGYVKGDVADVQALYSGASWHGANSVKFRMNRTACRVDLRGLGGTQGHAAEWRIQNNTKLIFSAEFG